MQVKKKAIVVDKSIRPLHGEQRRDVYMLMKLNTNFK